MEGAVRVGGIILFALLGLLPLLFPLLLHPSASGMMLMHGGVGATLLMTAMVLGSVFWMKRTIKSQTTAFGENDKARAKLVSLDLCAKYLYGFVIVTALGAAAFLAQSAWKLTEIQHHGARANANVIDIYTGPCSKRGCSIDVEYRFMPGGRNMVAPATGYAHLASSENPDDPHWAFAKANREVPIAYDISDPSVSALNFDDTVFQVDHVKATEFGVVLILGMFALVLGMLWLIIRSARAKQMRETGFA
jgi:hypothetical protein